MASHFVLDAITNGDLGVALLSLYDTSCYFFSVRDIKVVPIPFFRFHSLLGGRVLLSEVAWGWAPFAVGVCSVRWWGRRRNMVVVHYEEHPLGK